MTKELTCLDHLTLNNFHVETIHAFLIKNYGYSCKDFLFDLKVYWQDVIRRIRLLDQSEFCHLDVTIHSIHDEFLFIFNQENCYDKTKKLFRRRLGLDALEKLTGLYSFKVSQDRVVLFVKGEESATYPN